MTAIERIARAALSGDALATRALVQDWCATSPRVSDEPPPANPTDSTVFALSAALAELFATRLGQQPPAWTAAAGPAPAPVYLVRAAQRMRHLRAMCESESPPPLRRRGFFAPANYLAWF